MNTLKNLIENVEADCDVLSSSSTVPSNNQVLIYHAHALIDGKEYLISIVPTDLEGSSRTDR